MVRSTSAEIYSEVDRTTPNPSFAKEGIHHASNFQLMLTSTDHVSPPRRGYAIFFCCSVFCDRFVSIRLKFPFPPDHLKKCSMSWRASKEVAAK